MNESAEIEDFVEILKKKRPCVLIKIRRKCLLNEIHSYGILHGDIRLENIVVDSAGHPFIVDFALSSLESNPEKLNEELGFAVEY